MGTNPLFCLVAYESYTQYECIHTTRRLVVPPRFCALVWLVSPSSALHSFGLHSREKMQTSAACARCGCRLPVLLVTAVELPTCPPPPPADKIIMLLYCCTDFTNKRQTKKKKRATLIIISKLMKIFMFFSYYCSWFKVSITSEK